MPELPEVETTKRAIEPWLSNQNIDKVHCRQPQLRWPIPKKILTLKNQPILNIGRRGKYLWLECEPGYILIHLGMSGHLRIITDKQPANKHDHIDLCLQNGHRLRYHDPRRFGSWLWAEDLTTHPRLQSMGPEPLSRQFHGKYLWQMIQSRQTPIKTLLMNNQVVPGIGNIYANETLFLAGIMPTRSSNLLNLEDCQRIVSLSKKLLRQAIQAGATPLKDFRANHQPGYFQQQLWVYGRHDQPCKRCKTPLESETLGQRRTVFCPKCQV